MIKVCCSNAERSCSQLCVRSCMRDRGIDPPRSACRGWPQTAQMLQKSLWPSVCQLYACNQSIGGNVNPADGAPLAVTIEERKDNRGFGPHVSSGDTRMDQLLLQVLSICLSTHRKSSGSIFSAVGYAEVQKVPRPSTPSLALARANCPTPAVFVSPLAGRLRAADWDNVSPVS